MTFLMENFISDLIYPFKYSVQAFVEAQNKITVPFLEQCPIRGLYKERMTELYDYPKYSCHFKKGKRYVRLLSFTSTFLIGHCLKF